MTLVPETADAHSAGECEVDCPHPDCVCSGVVDLSLFDMVMFDDMEQACRAQSEALFL